MDEQSQIKSCVISITTTLIDGKRVTNNLNLPQSTIDELCIQIAKVIPNHISMLSYLINQSDNCSD